MLRNLESLCYEQMLRLQTSFPNNTMAIYIKLFEWRCTAPKYTNDMTNVGGKLNYLTCTYIRNHDGINHCYSFEEK